MGMSNLLKLFRVLGAAVVALAGWGATAPPAAA